MVDLIKAVKEEREPASGGCGNLDTVCIDLAALRSAEEHRPVGRVEIRGG
jgi:hypothetical protein